MSKPPDLSSAPSAGLGDVQRFTAVAAVVVLALLAVLAVVGILPAGEFARLSVKLLLVAGVIALASTAVALLLRRR